MKACGQAANCTSMCRGESIQQHSTHFKCVVLFVIGFNKHENSCWYTDSERSSVQSNNTTFLSITAYTSLKMKGWQAGLDHPFQGFSSNIQLRMQKESSVHQKYHPSSTIHGRADQLTLDFHNRTHVSSHCNTSLL